jgi:hypothetical protein
MYILYWPNKAQALCRTLSATVNALNGYEDETYERIMIRAIHRIHIAKTVLTNYLRCLTLNDARAGNAAASICC